MIRLSHVKHRFRGISLECRKGLIERYLSAADGRFCLAARDYLEEYGWRLHEGDLRLPANVVNDINLIVTGDLIIDGWYNDYNGGGGMLIVFGSMRCQHVLSWQGMFIGGDLRAQGLIYQCYNDWCFECLGEVAARAFICSDKSCNFDRERAIFEGRSDSSSDGETGPGAYSLLGFDENDDEYHDWDEITGLVEEAEAEGRSPFVASEPPATAPWREALHPATSGSRLAELAASNPWDVALRSQLSPDLQTVLAHCADSRVRWAAASAPWAEEAILRQLAAAPEPSVRAAVARHENCPQDLWTAFAADPASEVRAAVIHAHADRDAPWLPALAADPARLVRRAVAVVPNLPAEMVEVLSNDPDSAVKNRIMQVQSQSPQAIRAQLSSPDESVRLNLASAAAYGRPPFSFDKSDQPMRLEALRCFMLDPSPQIRKTATVYFLDPRFYEANAERFATDEVDGVRRAFAQRTRQAVWLEKLSTDADVYVRETVAKNPNTPAAVLIRMAGQVGRMTVGFDNNNSVVIGLMENPRLPVEALTALYQESIPSYCSVKEHPNVPVPLMVERECYSSPWTAGSKEYAALQHCLSYFANGRQPSNEELGELFHFMIFKAEVYSLRGHALANAACPPHILSRYVARFLRGEDKSGAYEMDQTAANPSLPQETILKLAAFLLAEGHHEVKEGFLRNPSVPVNVLTALALGSKDEDLRRDVLNALWTWHGLTGDEVATIEPALLADVQWLEPLDENDEDDVEDLIDAAIKEGDRKVRDGLLAEALEAFERIQLLVDKEGGDDYRRLFVHHKLMWLYKDFAFHQDSVADEEAARCRTLGLEQVRLCLEMIPRHAIMHFTPLGQMQEEAIRYAQNFFAWDAFINHADDEAALREALERIDDAISYSRGEEDGYLKGTRARLLVKLGAPEKASRKAVASELERRPYCEDFGELAEPILAELAQKYPGDADYPIALGLRREGHGDYQGAVAAYDEALAIMKNADDEAEVRAYSQARVLQMRGSAFNKHG